MVRETSVGSAQHFPARQVKSWELLKPENIIMSLDVYFIYVYICIYYTHVLNNAELVLLIQSQKRTWNYLKNVKE